MEPCKDCDRREVGCHIDCKDYISWCEKRKEEKAAREKYYQKYDPYAVFSTRKRKFYRKKGWIH